MSQFQQDSGREGLRRPVLVICLFLFKDILYSTQSLCYLFVDDLFIISL